MTDPFRQALNEVQELHRKKRADYGRYGDPYANVRASEEWGMPAWVGGMIRATDKIRRLQKYVKTGSLTNEGARDSFLDLITYAVISYVLWEETQAAETAAPAR